MRKRSAGLLMFRILDGGVQVLLVHPGGPFWARKDLGSWSIPKGEYEEEEDALSAALREFEEETGSRPTADNPIELGAIKQRSGKVVSAWAVEGDFDVARLKSNLFPLEWPRGSGVLKEYPEVDRAEWFSPRQARKKLISTQGEFVDRLISALVSSGRIEPDDESRTEGNSGQEPLP